MVGARARVRKHHAILSLAQRVEVIQLSKGGVSQRVLAQRFHCSKTQIQNTLANKQRFLDEWQGSDADPAFGAVAAAVTAAASRRGRTHPRTLPHQLVNEQVARWLAWETDRGVVVTGPEVQQKAREVAAELGVQRFAASNIWLSGFLKAMRVRLGKKATMIGSSLMSPTHQSQDRKVTSPQPVSGQRLHLQPIQQSESLQRIQIQRMVPVPVEAFQYTNEEPAPSVASKNWQVPQAPPAIQKQSAATQQLPPPPQPQKLVPPQVSAPKPIAPKPTSAQVSSLQPLPPPPEVCLRWNSYHSNMQATFPSLLNNEQFVDVTLACEGRSIKCHKMMLSACSAYFEELLSQNPCQHPIVLMKDLKYWEVQALVDFMYRGEVNVAQDKLPSLLAAAEALQIKGLAGPAFSSHDDESLPTTLPQPPFGGNEDYLDESSPPSPSGFRRAKKRRVPSTAQTTRSPPARSPVVQSSQMPVTPPRQSTGKRAVKSTPSMPSTSGIKQESSSSSEPLVRRARRSESGELEIKIEPIDIEISNDSMDQIDESYLEKTYETEVGDEELSAQGDDPGGTHQPETSASGDPQIIVHGQGSEQMDFGNDANDQNFTYDDSASQDGPSPELPGTSYHSQPMSSRMNNTSSNNLLGHM